MVPANKGSTVSTQRKKPRPFAAAAASAASSCSHKQEKLEVISQNYARNLQPSLITNHTRSLAQQSQEEDQMLSLRRNLFLHFSVRLLELLDRQEHQNSVPTAPQEVWEETVEESSRALCFRDRRERLHR